jgi:peptidyl-prolyl cis-trans isomerase C
MSQKKTSILSLSLAFLVGGLLGCSERSQGEASANPKAAAPKPAATAAAAAPAPATPGAVPTAPSAPTLPEDKLPAVVAKVGDRDIKKEELIKQAKEMQSQLGRMGRQENLSAAFYRQVLDGIILESLVKGDIAAAGITVTDAETKAQIDALKKNFPTEDAFKQALTAQGMSEADLQRQMHDRASLQKFVAEKISPQVVVTDEAAKKFYDENKERMKHPEQAHVRHILIKPASESAADKKVAKDKAEALLARVKKGEDFAKLATENSDDPGTKPRGGDLSFISRGQTVEPFEKAAFALKPNETSPVVETEFGYHVIQLLEHKNESIVPFEEAKERITTFLKQRDTDQKMRDHVSELRSKAKVSILLPEAPAAPATRAAAPKPPK